MYLFSGQLYLSENPVQLEQSIKYLSLSKELHEEVLSKSITDRRSYLVTLSLLARAYCINRDFKNGVELFEKSIVLEIEHIGDYHHNLVPKLANGGICAMDSGDTGKAKTWLRKAIEILDQHKSLHSMYEMDYRETIEDLLRSMQ